MFQQQEFYDWRSQAITQEFLKTLSDSANEFVATIVNRRESNPLDDQFIKGVIQGLSMAAGWKPELYTAEGSAVPDEA
jgi:hypothetical protein